MLKNKITFYAYISFPILLLLLISKLGLCSNYFFMFGLLLYAFILHPIISGIRLKQMGLISSHDFYKNFIPMWNLKFFGELYF